MLLADLTDSIIPSIDQIFLYPLLLFFFYREIRNRDKSDKDNAANAKEITRVESNYRSTHAKVGYLEREVDKHDQVINRHETRIAVMEESKKQKNQRP